jgi:predicted permease
MIAVNLALMMAIYVGIGFFARKQRIVEERFSSSLAALIFNFIFPCAVISSLQTEYDPASIMNGGALLGISIISMLILLALGLLVNKISGRKDDLSRILLINLMFTNFTYMAFPIMEMLYGSIGKFYIAVYTIPVRILFYIVTPLVFTIGKDKSASPTGKQIARGVLRAILSPPVLAVPVGLFIYFFSIRIPEPFSTVIEKLSSTASPLGMILCGVTLAAIPLSRIWREKRLFVIAALRLFIAPAIMLGLWFLVSSFVTVDPVVAKVSILYCALPAAATTTVLAIKAQSDATKAAQCVFITTLLSILTLPLWVEILNQVVGA